MNKIFEKFTFSPNIRAAKYNIYNIRYQSNSKVY